MHFTVRDKSSKHNEEKHSHRGRTISNLSKYKSFTHSDFVFSGQVGPLTQQLALRQGENAGRLPNQHRVVQLSVSRGCRN